jgi:hypothetical protein
MDPEIDSRWGICIQNWYGSLKAKRSVGDVGVQLKYIKERHDGVY